MHRIAARACCNKNYSFLPPRRISSRRPCAQSPRRRPCQSAGEKNQQSNEVVFPFYTVITTSWQIPYQKYPVHGVVVRDRATADIDLGTIGRAHK